MPENLSRFRCSLESCATRTAGLAGLLLLAGCAMQPERPEPAADIQIDNQPPYYLRAEGNDPFTRIDDAIRRVGQATSISPEEDPSQDIWTGLVDRFVFARCPDGSRAERWAAWFGERHDYLDRVMDRAHPWVYDIASELERRDLPGELALLPIVESAYDPFAYSHGQAAGAWQFMAATALEYGLEINEYYDGRRDVWSATRAALDYLTVLNQRFDGNWNLTLAAYNGGQGRVSRALRRNQVANRSTRWSELPLPKETLAYVPKLNGLGCLFRDPQRYGWQRPEWPSQPQVERIELPAAVDVVVLSALAELDLTEMVALNAGLSRHMTSPTGPHHLIVPRADAERVRAVLPELSSQDMIVWRSIEVRRGDTLSALAVRHATRVRALREANGLTSDRLSIGQRLRIPDGRALPERSPLADRYAQLAELQQQLLPTRRFRHVVRPGESLWVIARQYSVSVADIQRLNGLGQRSLIRPGQRLQIEMGQDAPAARVANYTVRRGDSLWLIARRHEVSLSDLMRWNGLNEASVLKPGQTLTLGGGG